MTPITWLYWLVKGKILSKQQVIDSLAALYGAVRARSRTRTAHARALNQSRRCQAANSAPLAVAAVAIPFQFAPLVSTRRPLA